MNAKGDREGARRLLRPVLSPRPRLNAVHHLATVIRGAGRGDRMTNSGPRMSGQGVSSLNPDVPPTGKNRSEQSPVTATSTELIIRTSKHRIFGRSGVGCLALSSPRVLLPDSERAHKAPVLAHVGILSEIVEALTRLLRLH